jgi:hypothetical protein
MPIYVGDTIRITMNVGADISGVTILIKYKSPTGKTGSWSPQKMTPTSVLYITKLNESGAWELQAYVPEWPAHGRIAKLFVSRVLY